MLFIFVIKLLFIIFFFHFGNVSLIIFYKAINSVYSQKDYRYEHGNKKKNDNNNNCEPKVRVTIMIFRYVRSNGGAYRFTAELVTRGKSIPEQGGSILYSVDT